jgi:predicted ArsR family transcriptional regulator
MTGKTTTPKEVLEMLTLREAGYTVLSISQRLNISVRTVYRHLEKYGTEKGSLKQAAIDKARGELLGLITTDTAIREEAAKLIADDLAHANHLRAIIIEASEHLKATTIQEAALVMRAAAAYAVALKATADITRHSLALDRTRNDSEELPELVVSELTKEQIDEMKELALVGDG